MWIFHCSKLFVINSFLCKAYIMDTSTYFGQIYFDCSKCTFLISFRTHSIQNSFRSHAWVLAVRIGTVRSHSMIWYCETSHELVLWDLAVRIGTVRISQYELVPWEGCQLTVRSLYYELVPLEPCPRRGNMGSRTFRDQTPASSTASD